MGKRQEELLQYNALGAVICVHGKFIGKRSLAAIACIGSTEARAFWLRPLHNGVVIRSAEFLSDAGNLGPYGTTSYLQKR